MNPTPIIVAHQGSPVMLCNESIADIVVLNIGPTESKSTGGGVGINGIAGIASMSVASVSGASGVVEIEKSLEAVEAAARRHS